MKSTFHMVALALLLLASPRPCLAMMGIEDVGKDRAKALGIEVHAQPAGPDAVWIEVSFKTQGALRDFDRVDCEMYDHGKLLLSATLKEKRSNPDRVTVSLTVDRGQLDRLTLRIVTGVPLDMTGHDLHLRDFVDLAKLH